MAGPACASAKRAIVTAFRVHISATIFFDVFDLYSALAFASRKRRMAVFIYGGETSRTSCGAASAGAKFTGNHLTILTRRLPGLECPRQCAAIVIDNDEAFFSASKCDLVAAVILPIAGKEIADGRVTKPHHV